ncbi:MAG: tetratricopeptide repeat protein [Chitinophagaceae bacterium]|nr:MAG: tetratricopeptide repeat protein [Chitinophagaceae bacterium]
MAETKVVTPAPREDHEIVVERAKDFWTRNNRLIMTLGLGIIVLAVGYLGYKKLIKEPNEVKASEAMFRAENYFRADSLNLALNGDGQAPGFLKIISQYGGTKAGNLAHFYAGDIYLQQGDAAKAISHLDDFETDAAQIQARAYKLLGDAYAEQGKTGDALSAYKKAAHHFEQDEVNAAEYLFVAAYYAQRVANNPKDAADLYRELKSKYPRSNRGAEADKYLAQLGVYSTEKK